MRNRWERVAEAWCRFFHQDAMRPVKGHYLCRTCKRAYPVPWQEGENYARRAHAANAWARQNLRQRVEGLEGRAA